MIHVLITNRDTNHKKAAANKQQKYKLHKFVELQLRLYDVLM